MWQPELKTPVALIGGFGGLVVRNSDTGQLGYFKIRKYKWDVACANLAVLAGVLVPKIEFTRIGIQQGAVSHFWGDESIDICQYKLRHGHYPSTEMYTASGYLAFISWLGYGDLRNEHLLWSPNGIALIDYDDALTWRYETIGHLFGPSLLLRFYNPDQVKAMVAKIQSLSLAQIQTAFTSLVPEYRFAPHEETNFSLKLFADAQTLHHRLKRYWEKELISRDRYPVLHLQDETLWRKPAWRRSVEACPHEYAEQNGLWRCPKCNFWWPLSGQPDAP